MESGATAAPQKKKMNPFTLALILLAKLFKFIKAFKLFSVFVKFGKLWVTFATMAFSVIVYAFAMGGWWFAAGLVGMLFIHEMGHVWALRRDGLEAKAPVFIPMIGAVIFAPSMGNREQEARVGYAGPLIGSLGTLVVFGMALLSSGDLRTILLLTAYLGAFINLFNLIIPIRPLDGGRVTQIVGEWFKYLGLVVLVTLMVAFGVRGLLVIMVLVLIDFQWPLKFKMTLGLLIEVCLVYMVWFQIGEFQPLWVDIIDLFMVTVLNIMLIAQVTANEDVLAEQHGPNKTPWPVRIKWLSYYFGLMAALAVLMAQIIPMLPKELTGN